MTGRISEELDVQLALLYGDGTGDLKVTFAPIQQQRGCADCGLFAAAVCLALAPVDPATIRWKQNQMRTHLSDCFNNEILTPFPTMESKSLRPRMTSKLTPDYTIKLWCVCHKNMLL